MYWELGARRAVRMQDWKAIRPARGKPWALYDLAVDPSERNDLSQQEPDLLKRLQTYARQAHQPAVPGTFSDRTRHERDRQAKQGFKK
jgi:arylsulfatase A-like enzyme